MAALVITAANVVSGANAVTEDGTAGETITAGMLVYKDAADNNEWKKADANLSAAAAAGYGIALANAANNQPLRVQTAGEITIGAVVAIGTVYVAGATVAGDINPSTDLVAGWFTFVVGVGKTTGIISLIMRGPGVAVP